MSKGRISGSRGKTRQPAVRKISSRKKKKASAPKEATPTDPSVHRFIGISLGGGKSDKACLAVMEYYPQHKKVFLSRLIEKIKNEEHISADLKLKEIIDGYGKTLDLIAFDVPFRLPVELRDHHAKENYDISQAEHIRWMREHTRKLNKNKKPKKTFTPYTQRCVEMYIATELEEPFNIHHAMGANCAPHLARAMYLKRQFKTPVIEVFPKLSVWRIGRSLGVMKSHLRFHKHAVGGDESRRLILQAVSEKNVVFVYDADVKLMIENNHAFEAFICAFTAYLKFKGKTEPRPTDFPKEEDWIEFPT
jgi:hypothetical protein